VNAKQNGHLLSFRQGWQSENLALYFLYQFAFVARPWNIADDLGVDYYCTLFDVVDDKFLQPRSAFSVQVKSDDKEIDISNKADYIANLQMPFFVAAVDKQSQSMEVYSGEYVQHFFALLGNPLHSKNTDHYKGNGGRLLIRPAKTQVGHQQYYKVEGKDHVLLFPYVGSVSTAHEADEIKALSEALGARCLHIQSNISAMRAGSYVFSHFGSANKSAVAGSSSVNTFRENFQFRLGEVFHNLLWLHNARPDEFKIEEFRRYERALFSIIDDPINTLTLETYKQLKCRVDGYLEDLVITSTASGRRQCNLGPSGVTSSPQPFPTGASASS
jgi:hypothetical protein